MRRRTIESAWRAWVTAAALATTVSSPALPAQAPPATLAITGDVSTPLSLALDELKTLPRKTVEVSEDGRTVRYEGVLIGELLKRAGVPVGVDLRGGAVASYIVAHAADGYRAVFALAEVDPAFTSNDVIVADTIDGKPLFAYQGPLRIVAPRDSRGARSVRMLQRIHVVTVPK